jgi:hypothetical protein
VPDLQAFSTRRLAVNLSAASGSRRPAGGQSKARKWRRSNWCLRFWREWVTRYFRLKGYYSCNLFPTNTAMMIRAGAMILGGFR